MLIRTNNIHIIKLHAFISFSGPRDVYCVDFSYEFLLLFSFLFRSLMVSASMRHDLFSTIYDISTDFCIHVNNKFNQI